MNHVPPDDLRGNDDSWTVGTVCGILAVIMIVAGIVVFLAN